MAERAYFWPGSPVAGCQPEPIEQVVPTATTRPPRPAPTSADAARGAGGLPGAGGAQPLRADRGAPVRAAAAVVRLAGASVIAHPCPPGLACWGSACRDPIPPTVATGGGASSEALAANLRNAVSFIYLLRCWTVLRRAKRWTRDVAFSRLSMLSWNP